MLVEALFSSLSWKPFIVDYILENEEDGLVLRSFNLWVFPLATGHASKRAVRPKIDEAKNTIFKLGCLQRRR